MASCARKVTETGKASYYADSFNGRKTASGAIFRQNKLTAAHKTLPFGTKVTVINNRGPFVQGRIIDLSSKAARRIGMINTGVANVEVKYKKKKK
jgi:rare lipoprotein A